MSVLAVALKELVALGVSGDALVAAIDRLDAAAEAERCETLAEAVDAASRRADAEMLSPGAMRTRAYRARRASQDASPSVTKRHQASPSVTQDTPEAKVSPRPLSKTQTLEPSEPKGSSGITTRTRGAVPKTRPQRRCPEVWRPSEADLAVGEREGFVAGEIERELAKFRDHQFATARSDWSAAFRNWLRKASENQPRPRHDRPSPNNPGRAASRGVWADIAAEEAGEPVG